MNNSANSCVDSDKWCVFFCFMIALQKVGAFIVGSCGEKVNQNVALKMCEVGERQKYNWSGFKMSEKGKS